MNKVQIKRMRVMLLVTWVAVSSLLLLLGSCAAERMEDEPDERPVPGMKYPITFASLTVAGEVETRAAAPMASGTLRLLVYGENDALATATPVANRTYTVANGVLTVADGGEPLSLEAGKYRFYALSPSTLNPAKGVVSNIGHGVDLLASLTDVTVLPTGISVTLASLAHKASKVSFSVAKATAGATFFSLEKPTSLILYSQAGVPVNFQLGADGGSLTTAAGTSTVELKEAAFSQSGSGADAVFQAADEVIPRSSGAFNVVIQAKVVLKQGEAAVPYTLRAKTTPIAFEAGKNYKFDIRVQDPHKLITVTPWTEVAWTDDPY